MAESHQILGASPYDSQKFSPHIFEREYVEGVLGIQIPLNESAPYSAQYRQQIIEERLLLEGFFDSFKKLGGQLKEFALGIRYVIEDPSRIKEFSKAVIDGVSGLYDKLMSWAESTLKFLKEIVKHWKPAEKISGLIKTIWETVKKLWESTEGMSGWKKALAVIAVATGVKYVWNQITEDDDGWSDMSDEEKGKYLEKLMGSMSGDLKKVAGESADYSSHSLVTALYHTDTDERLDEFLKGLKDKVSGKKSDAKDWIKNLPDDLQKETESRLESLSKIAKKVGTKIIKKLALNAVMGAISGGVATFMSYVAKAMGGIKLVMSVVGEPMSKFVGQIKDKKKEEAEAAKGKDDPTEKSGSKNESFDFRKHVESILSEHHGVTYETIT